MIFSYVHNLKRFTQSWLILFDWLQNFSFFVVDNIWHISLSSLLKLRPFACASILIKKRQNFWTFLNVFTCALTTHKNLSFEKPIWEHKIFIVEIFSLIKVSPSTSENFPFTPTRPRRRFKPFALNGSMNYLSDGKIFYWLFLFKKISATFRDQKFMCRSNVVKNIKCNEI